MASDLPPGGAATSTPISSSDSDFAFAFNSSIFSHRILRIEIIPDLRETKPDTQGCTTLANETGNRKRRRQDIERDDVVGSVEHPEEQIFSDQLPEMVEGVGKNQDEEAVAKVERSPSDAGVNADRLGYESACRDDPSRSMDCSTVLKVETICISVAILAARSSFFYKLFSNGMLESDQRHVTLRIHSSEEAALMDLLNFMYSNTLTVRSPVALLDVLMAADKFEVVSCMRYCGRLLQDLPMTRESALRYLDLPSTVLNAAAVQPLIQAAKQFLAGLYKDITKFHDDILNLPLVGIEAVLSSDDLQVDSEDAVFDFVLKWARAHYPKLEERREVFGSRLHRLVRFPFMTCKKLAMFLFCEEFDRELVRKLVLGALFLKARAPAYRWRPLASESADFVCRRIVERAYKLRPVKVVEFQLPRQQSIVYLDLKREECTHLFPVDSVRSQAFYLGGQVFYLSAECRKDQQSSLHFFGLILGMHGTTSERLSVEMEFSARSKPTEDYMRKYRGIATFTGGDVFGCQSLFNIPWTTFMADKSPYFINGILHLRSVLTVKQ